LARIRVYEAPSIFSASPQSAKETPEQSDVVLDGPRRLESPTPRASRRRAARLENGMKLTPGTRLKSAACDTEAVVVRVPSEGEITCGGAPMIPFAEAKPEGVALDASAAGGTLMGKRYHDQASGLEMLCTKPGKGGLAIDGRPLELREAKQLPSSD